MKHLILIAILALSTCAVSAVPEPQDAETPVAVQTAVAGLPDLARSLNLPQSIIKRFQTPQ